MLPTCYSGVAELHPTDHCDIEAINSHDPTTVDQRWYALIVRPNHDKKVERSLGNRGLPALSPVYRSRRAWRDRQKDVDLPLFPGYVFCRFSYEQRLVALGTPGIRSVVSFGRKPHPIPEDEIEAVRSIMKSGLPAMPWPYLKAGQRVRLVGGCLDGLPGTLIREKEVCRLVVTVEILMRSVAVEVDRASVSPIQ
jgi:transcription antitermination factor NusG